MLSRARSSGLCHGCRQDLQVFFERGFCGPAVKLNARNARPRLQWRRPAAARQLLRQFSYSSSTFQEHRPSDHVEGRSRTRDGGEAEKDIEPEQLQVLHELENALGRPIDEAMHEDRTSSTVPHDRFPDDQIQQDYEIESVRGTIDPLSHLRASGASHEDIAREARQVYGDGLPQNALEEPELKIYKRLYGEPASSSYEEFMDEEEASAVEEGTSNQLLDREGDPIELSEAQAAELGLVEEKRPEESIMLHADGVIDLEPSIQNTSSPSSPSEERVREVALMLKGEVLDKAEQEQEDEDDDEDDEEVDSSLRAHPFTQLGKFATVPRSVFLPQEHFVEPVQDIMSKYSNKHLKDMCEKTFGGPGLPDSPLTPRSGKIRPQVAISLNASQPFMGEMEANAFVTAIMPPTYAAVMSVLVETRKRLGATWLNNLLAKEGGPRVLDAGAGGAGVIAWREVVQAHWDSLHSSDKGQVPPLPPTKSVVLTGAEKLRHRAASLLQNTTFIPRLPDYVHTRDTPTLQDDRPAQQRKQFDVIIAPHSLFPMQEDYMRRHHVHNLWSMLSSEGGVLILIEKGIPRGFEAIGAARDLLLERYIAVPEGRTSGYSAIHNDPEDIHIREPGMIIAPCTTHERCPMYKTPGLSKGRKDFCSFQQRYIRPAYLQRVLGAKDRNHDDVDFSYVAVMKGDDLRLRQNESWMGIEDPLSAPMHPNPQLAAEDYASWTVLSPKGFEDVHPEKIIPSPFTNAGNPPSTLPSAHTLPRLVFSPMKRRGHVILDVCTPAGAIERWTVPRSFSLQAYRDARKSRWGDLWALGAKTVIDRNLRLGGENTKEAMKARGRKERLKQQAEELMEKMHDEQLEEMEEMKEMERDFKEGRFTGGEGVEERKVKKSGPGGKIKRKSFEGGIQSFTVDDFDMSEVNPPMIASPRTNTSPQAEGGSKQTTTPAPPDVEDEDDLTPEELSILHEWNAVLSGEEGSGIPIKGPRAIRDYSKFAAKGTKKVARKSGKQR